MQILGIDPGYGTTGFALVEAHRGLHQLRQCGVITTPPGMDFPKRLETLYLDMDQLLKSALPEALAIEELFFGHNVTTGIGVAQARGVILLASEFGCRLCGGADFRGNQGKPAVCVSPPPLRSEQTLRDASV